MRFQFTHANVTHHVDIERSDSTVTLKRGDEVVIFEVSPTLTGFRLTHDGSVFDTTLGTVSGEDATVFVNGRAIPVKFWDDRKPRASGNDKGNGSSRHVRSVMPGRVAKILVRKGDSVAKGEPLLVLEAMKMENEIKASNEGVVQEIRVVEGASVEAGTLMVVLE